MKSKFLNYIKNYRVCILLNSIMLAIFAFSCLIADIKKYGIFNFSEVLIICGIPLYSVIYAIASYCSVKRISPPLVIFAVMFAAFEIIIEVIFGGRIYIFRVLLIALPGSVLCFITLEIVSAIYHAMHDVTVDEPPVKPEGDDTNE